MAEVNIVKEFEAMLVAAVEQEGLVLARSADNIAAYMHARAMHLSMISREPGFDRAVIAEANNVAMHAGLVGHEAVSESHHRTMGMIGGAIRIAAILLA